MKKFQVGDKVYLPYFSTRVLEIESNSNSTTVPLRISTGYCSESFTKEGCINGHVTSTGIVLATQENKELLGKLYGVEFEAPPPKTVSVTLEVPEPFEPKLNEMYWYLDDCCDVNVSTLNTDLGDNPIKFKWRTRREAVQALNIISATFGMPL